MNKKDIKSAVSIEFGMSIERSGKVVDNIFENLIEHFRKNKIVEIQKFGKFKMITGKDSKKYKLVKFTPSKKLSQRVNNDFENLKKVKVSLPKDFKLQLDLIGIEFRNPERFNVENNTNHEVSKNILQEKSSEVTSIDHRKIISADLIMLHKEITKDEAAEINKNNLWG